MSKINSKEPQEITDYALETYGSGLLDGVPLPNLLEQIQAIQNKYEAKGYHKVWLEIDMGGYGDYVDFGVAGNRMETEQEVEKRIEKWKKNVENERKRKAKAASAREKKEKVAYEKLRKKYGDGK